MQFLTTRVQKPFLFWADIHFFEPTAELISHVPKSVRSGDKSETGFCHSACERGGVFGRQECELGFQRHISTRGASQQRRCTRAARGSHQQQQPVCRSQLTAAWLLFCQNSFIFAFFFVFPCPAIMHYALSGTRFYGR